MTTPTTVTLEITTAEAEHLRAILADWLVGRTAHTHPEPIAVAMKLSGIINEHLQRGRPNVGHGHVQPRPDGMKARCGGPTICSVCSLEAAQQKAIVEPFTPQ